VIAPATIFALHISSVTSCVTCTSTASHHQDGGQSRCWIYVVFAACWWVSSDVQSTEKQNSNSSTF